MLLHLCFHFEGGLTFNDIVTFKVGIGAKTYAFHNSFAFFLGVVDSSLVTYVVVD